MARCAKVQTETEVSGRNGPYPHTQKSTRHKPRSPLVAKLLHARTDKNPALAKAQAKQQQREATTNMATTAFLPPAKLPLQGRRFASPKTAGRISVRVPPARAQQEQQVKEEEAEAASVPPPQAAEKEARKGDAQSLPRQPLAESKNMSREYGGQWLSSTTRHVRIYAAYIDPVTNAFDQTQMDKLTLMLDPQDEFAWTDEACQMVFNEFQDLVDHYEVTSVVAPTPTAPIVDKKI